MNTSVKIMPGNLSGQSALQPAYRLSFTACALCRLHSGNLVKLYADFREWDKTFQAAMDANLVQARTISSQKRVTRELVSRLKMLNARDLALFADASPQEQNCLLWLAICRCYQFVGDFACEVIHENFINNKTLSHDDYNIFFQNKAEWHPELDKLADSTRQKLRQTLFLIMRDAGILDKNNEIRPIFVSAPFRRYLAALKGREGLFFPGQESGVSNHKGACE